jgi:hypothetical protein
MENILWMRNATSLKINYELFNDVFIFGEGSYSKISGIMSSEYTPDFYKGKTKTASLGVNIGF